MNEQNTDFTPELSESETTGPRILLADDNPVHRQLIGALLRQSGCLVDVVDDGVQAIERFRERRYDLVLMDWQMPQLDGVEATKKIRDIERETGTCSGRRVPVIALTAHSLPRDRAYCLTAGMDDYLCKPARKGDLDLLLARWLGPAAIADDDIVAQS